MFRNKKGIVILLCTLLLLTSCKPEVKDTSIPKTDDKQINIEVQNIEDIDKEQLQVLARGINGVFNPLFAMSEGDKAVSYAMFIPFIGLKRKMETDSQNSIVSSIKREGYILEFELDKDLYWWDGKPITTNDVYFTLKILLNNAYVGDKRRGELFFINGAMDFYNGVSDSISGVEIIDDKHMIINFDNFQDSFYYALDFRPIPEHYYQRLSVKDIASLNDKPLGNSAFKIVDWEKNNFANLVRVDDFKYDSSLKYISIREIDRDNILTEMLRGNIDAASFHNTNDFLNQFEINNNFNNEIVVENETLILRLSNYNKLSDINIREGVFNSILKYKDNQNLKMTHSLISPSNKAFVDTVYEEAEVEVSPISINILFEDADYISEVANDLKEILSDDGYVVTLNSTNIYDIMNTAQRFIENGRNVLVLSSFKHGYMPDFSKEFSSIGEGKILYQDVNFDEEIFATITDKKSDLKDAYKLLLNDIESQKLAIGIGSPIVKTYQRIGLKNFFNTEFRDWHEFAIWDIIWQ